MEWLEGHSNFWKGWGFKLSVALDQAFTHFRGEGDRKGDRSGVQTFSQNVLKFFVDIKMKEFIVSTTVGHF